MSVVVSKIFNKTNILFNSILVPRYTRHLIYNKLFSATGSGPHCSCNPDSSSTSLTLLCIVEYADFTINPIPGIMTWIVNGAYYSTDQPYMNRTDYLTCVYTLLSTITVDVSSVNNYQCIFTFGEPFNIQYDYIASNAPEFNASCSTPSEYLFRNKTKPEYKNIQNRQFDTI